MIAYFDQDAFRGRAELSYLAGPRNGPPLLLLHGVTRNWSDWQILLRELTEKWRVVILDQRGHGASEHLGGNYRVIDYAEDAVEFVSKFFDEPVTILGHSLGAMVALYVAAECGPRVVGAILEDPPFHTMGNRISQTPYHAQFSGMQEVARRDLDAVGPITDALSEIQIPTPDGLRRLGDVRDRESLRHSAACLLAVDPEIFTPLIAGKWLEGFDHESLWARVKCPILLLQGDPAASGALTNEDVTIAREKCPHAQHRFFAGVGHQIHRTRPAEVIAAVNDFAT